MIYPSSVFLFELISVLKILRLRDPKKSRFYFKKCQFFYFKKMNSECPICQEEITSERCELECKHVFHSKCIVSWAVKKAQKSQKANCPLCRFDILKSSPAEKPKKNDQEDSRISSVRHDLSTELIENFANTELQPEQLNNITRRIRTRDNAPKEDNGEKFLFLYYSLVFVLFLMTMLPSKLPAGDPQ